MAENNEYCSILDDSDVLLEERETVEETGENLELFHEATKLHRSKGDCVPLRLSNKQFNWSKKFACSHPTSV